MTTRRQIILGAGAAFAGGTVRELAERVKGRIPFENECLVYAIFSPYVRDLDTVGCVDALFEAQERAVRRGWKPLTRHYSAMELPSLLCRRPSTLRWAQEQERLIFTDQASCEMTEVGPVKAFWVEMPG